MTAQTRTGLQFHLIIDAAGGTSRSVSAPAPAADGGALVVPAGFSFLVTPDGQKPTLTTSPPSPNSEFVVLEPVQIGSQHLLLMLNPHRCAVRVNGAACPCMAVLHEQDTIECSSDYELHVSLYHAPYVGRAPAEIVGKECPVCRVKFTSTSRVLMCACGCPLHLAEEQEPKETQLQCALVTSECPWCQRTLHTTPQYSYLPAEVGVS